MLAIMADDPTHRALQLLSLLSGRRAWSGGELAERLRVTDRTLRRDVERLRGLGYVVEGTTGTAGGYRLVAGADVPPLFLDDDEAVAIAAALITAAGDRTTGMVDSSTRALAKLNHVLPAALFRRVAAVHAATRTVEPSSGPDVDPGTVATLAEAVRDRVQVRFDYEARDGRRSERRVEPRGLVTVARTWYLAGWDLDRTDWRVFRIDRATAVVATGHGAPARDLSGGPAALVGRAIARTPMAHHATLAVARSADAVAAAHPTVLRDRIVATGTASCEVRLAADTPAALVGQVVAFLQLTPDVHLDAPADVVDALATTAATIQAALPTP